MKSNSAPTQALNDTIPSDDYGAKKSESCNASECSNYNCERQSLDRDQILHVVSRAAYCCVLICGLILKNMI